MFQSRTIAAVVFAILAGAQGAVAQNRPTGPAETPPGSFEGMQYIDSRGCAFIRAGMSGTTTWVPRLNSERRPLCGFQPSLQASAPPPPAVPVAAPEPEQPPASVAQATPAAPAAAPPPSPAPQARAPERVAPRPPLSVAPRRPAFGDPIPTVAGLTTPPRVATPAALTPQAQDGPLRMTLSAFCEGRSGVQDGFVNAGTGEPIDCGTAPEVSEPVRLAADLPQPLGAIVADPAIRRATLGEVCAEMATGNVRFINHETGQPVVCPDRAGTVAQAMMPGGPVAATAPGGPGAAGKVLPPLAEPIPVASIEACTETVGRILLMGGPGGSVICGGTTVGPAMARARLLPGPPPVIEVRNPPRTGDRNPFAAPVPASNPVRAPFPTQPTPGYRHVWDDGRINPLRGLSPVRATPFTSSGVATTPTRSPFAAP